MSGSALQALEDGSLWGQFCDDLKAAGQLVAGQAVPAEALTRAEGYRYLTRLLRLSLEKNLEFNNPSYPQFYSLSHETAKIGNDNPDNYYLNCEIDAALDYRIWGHCGSVDYMSIESKAGSFAGGGDMAASGHILLSDLQVDEQGNFEILVSQQQQPGNWLPLGPDSDNLLVRQTFRNRQLERPAQLNIACLNPQGLAQLDPQSFSAQLQQVVPFVAGTASLFRNWMDVFSAHVNQLPPNDQQLCLRAGGDPDIHYHNSYWRLAENEALLIEFTPPGRCRSWNFQLSNYWMESLDYRYYPICINSHNAAVSDDGVVRIVVSHHQTDAWPNWLSTAGHTEGAMLLRYVQAADFPPVTCTVFDVADLGVPR